MGPLTIEIKLQLAQVISNCRLEYLDTSSVMGIGMYDAKERYRILFKIPINKIPKDAEIVSAELKLGLIAKKSNYANIITPYALIGNWTLNTVTWYNQPAFNPKLFGQSMTVREASQYAFDITDIVQKWHTNEVSNNGIILKNQEIDSRTLARTIADIKKSYEPKVEIFYKLKCSCESAQTIFINKSEELDTNDSYRFCKIRNTSLTKTVIFFVENIKIHKITAHLQVSPDGINFINDPTEILVEMNEIKFIVPCIFARFTRVAVKNIHTGETSRVKIWYQSQE